MIKFFGDIAISLWCWWSNYRFRECIRSNIGTEPEDKISTLQDLKALVKRLYDGFIWTADDITQLGDAITPPPQNYAIHLDRPLRDDCDGFHSLVYHCLYNSGIDCYLLTVTPKKINDGHCVLLFYLDGEWHVNDYTKVYQGFKTPEEAIKDYNKIYLEKYDCTGPIIYNGLVEYNYASGKFSRVTIKDIIKNK